MHIDYRGGGTQLWFGYVCPVLLPKWGSNEPTFFLVKVRSMELQNFHVLRTYELKFEPNFGCRADNNSKFWKNSLVGVKIYYFCSKCGCSKELNHAATGDLKNGRRGMKRGSWPPDIPIPPFQVSAPSGIDRRSKYKCFYYLTTFASKMRSSKIWD